MTETDPSRTPLSPTSMTLSDAARLLTACGPRPVTVGMLQADVEAGAPTGEDGTLNLVHYAAWLVREMGSPTGKTHGD